MTPRGPDPHRGYGRRMGEITARELRNDTLGILRRVESGEEIHVTVSGRPVAVLSPLSQRARWMPRARMAALLDAHSADPALAAELRELPPGTTDDR